MNARTTNTFSPPHQPGRGAAKPMQRDRPASDARRVLAFVFRCVLPVLAGTAGTAHAQAELVDDINTGFSPSAGSSPLRFARIGSLSFFRACDRPHGCELWQSDGTAAGTRLVADLCSGPCSSEPDHLMASRDNVLFFSADDGQHGREPWVYEPGPFARPAMLVDANPGALSSHPIGFVQTVTGEVSTRVYFMARDSAVEDAEHMWYFARRSGETWVTGTVMTAGTHVGRAVAEDDRLFYKTRDGDEGEKLVMMRPRVSGSEQTYLDIRPDTGSAGIDHLIAVPDLGGVFFRADNGSHGAEPWFSDGTQAATRMIADLAPGPTGSALREPVAYGGRVYFLANDGNGGDSHDLWGTTLTLTQKIRNHPSSATTGLAVLGDQMIYVATETASGREFWRSNGTVAGTAQIVDLIPGPEGLGSPGGAAVAGAYYYFAAGPQLHRTDGTAAGTRAVGAPTDISLTLNGELHGRADGVLYAGYVDGRGYELFASSIATPTQAGLVKLIEPAIGDSDPRHFAALAAGNVLFAYSEDTGHALRRVDPAGGTDVLLAGSITLHTARTTRDPPHHLFFRRLPGQQLWRSDGSSTGTTMLLDLAAAPFHATYIECIFPVSANDAFILAEVGSGHALLRTDGTVAGTTMLLTSDTMPSNTFLSFSSCPTPLAGSILFSAFREGFGYELFRNNGTPGHIALVRDIAPGPTSGMVDFDALFVAHGRAWFAANGSSSGTDIEPWVSDGTAQGTHALGDVNTQGSSLPHSFTAFAYIHPEDGLRQGVMFAARTATTGHQAMFSDGSPGGALSIAIPALRGEAGSLPSSEALGPAIVASGGDLFFKGTLHITGGSHLLHLSGQTLTARVIAPPGASAPIAPQRMVGFDGGVAFSGYSANGGRELWYSDGSDAGTFATSDIAPGTVSAGPLDIAVLGDGVHFAAEDGISGREPWRLPLPRAETIFANGFE
jgi:ELWxxDGT repeat protein